MIETKNMYEQVMNRTGMQGIKPNHEMENAYFFELLFKGVNVLSISTMEEEKLTVAFYFKGDDLYVLEEGESEFRKVEYRVWHGVVWDDMTKLMTEEQVKAYYVMGIDVEEALRQLIASEIDIDALFHR